MDMDCFAALAMTGGCHCEEPEGRRGNLLFNGSRNFKFCIPCGAPGAFFEGGGQAVGPADLGG